MLHATPPFAAKRGHSAGGHGRALSLLWSGGTATPARHPPDAPQLRQVTMTTAIASAFTHKKVKHDVGMTGEITLRGRVLPIGGLKEKSIAAHRSGLKTILIPSENVRDLDEIPEEIKSSLEIIPVSNLDEVLKLAFVK